MVVTGVLESPVGSKEIIPVENGCLCVTVLEFCVELGARSGRQGAAGVQPEHLAVLGLREKHPARKAVTAVRVFVGDVTQAKEQSEKLIFPAERSELILFGCGVGGLLVAILGTQHRPDEAAKFSGHGDLGLVALEAASQQADKASV